MSSRSATRRASPASMALQQPFLRSSRTSSPCVPVRMNNPMTSYPRRLRSQTATELPTPPLMARPTRDIPSPWKHEKLRRRAAEIGQHVIAGQFLVFLDNVRLLARSVDGDVPRLRVHQPH